MSTWTIKLQGSTDERVVPHAATSPVFVINHKGKSYVSILVQEIDKLPQAAQTYYRDKFSEAEVDSGSTEARMVAVYEPDLIHPVNVSD
jgi:hypothetical protein